MVESTRGWAGVVRSVAELNLVPREEVLRRRWIIFAKGAGGESQ